MSYEILVGSKSGSKFEHARIGRIDTDRTMLLAPAACVCHSADRFCCLASQHFVAVEFRKKLSNAEEESCFCGHFWLKDH